MLVVVCEVSFLDTYKVTIISFDIVVFAVGLWFIIVFSVSCDDTSSIVYFIFLASNIFIALSRSSPIKLSNVSSFSSWLLSLSSELLLSLFSEVSSLVLIVLPTVIVIVLLFKIYLPASLSCSNTMSICDSLVTFLSSTS